MAARRKVLSRKTGNSSDDPGIGHAGQAAEDQGVGNQGAQGDAQALAQLSMVWPEYQIRVDTASTLMMGMMNPMRMPNRDTPASPRGVHDHGHADVGVESVAAL
jgi:hypothetical protein